MEKKKKKTEKAERKMQLCLLIYCLLVSHDKYWVVAWLLCAGH